MICAAPQGWMPNADRALVEEARLTQALGSKQPSPTRAHGPRTIGSAQARRFPPDAAAAAAYLVHRGCVVPCVPSPLDNLAAVFVVMSVRREGVWHAVLDGACTAHVRPGGACICVLAMDAYTAQLHPPPAPSATPPAPA